MIRPCKPATYVRAAKSLLRTQPDGVISAGQVAYRAHTNKRAATDCEIHADSALRASGLFAAVYPSRFNIALWRLKEQQP
jgi:hypothetical protein